jgi:hypothetical protein
MKKAHPVLPEWADFRSGGVLVCCGRAFGSNAASGSIPEPSTNNS